MRNRFSWEEFPMSSLQEHTELQYASPEPIHLQHTEPGLEGPALLVSARLGSALLRGWKAPVPCFGVTHHALRITGLDFIRSCNR